MCVWCSVWHTGTVVARSRPAGRVKLLSHSIPHVRIGTYSSYSVRYCGVQRSVIFNLKLLYILKYSLFSLSLALSLSLSLSLSLFLYKYIYIYIYSIYHSIYLSKDMYLRFCTLSTKHWYASARKVILRDVLCGFQYHSSNCSLFFKVWMQQHNWSTIQLKGVLNSPFVYLAWTDMPCKTWAGSFSSAPF